MPRKKAYQIIMDVVYQGAYASLSMKQIHDFDAKDMGLLSELVYGTLRNWTLCEVQWQPFVKQKVSKSARVLLNLGVYQIHFMDRVPEYAILNETVNLASKHEKGFINAVLRKCLNEPLKLSKDEQIVKRLAINCSKPEWLLNLWKKHYGEETMVKLAQNSLKPSSMTYRINPLKITKAELEKDEKVHFIDEFAFTYEGNLIQSEWFQQGLVVVQDLSSQKAALALEAQNDELILDACAAPGSKTTLVAAMMHNTGKIIACDLYESRLKLIEEACERLGITNIETKAMDSTKAHETFEKESFDRMLLDVPCSGLGTLRQKPEIAMTCTPEILDEIIAIQKEILESCHVLLKKGGTMVYSTCTLNQKENSKQVQAFLSRHPEFELVNEETCFPFEGDWDGFYVARLLKRA